MYPHPAAMASNMCAYLTESLLYPYADVILQLLSASLEEEDPTVYNILQRVHDLAGVN